MKTSDKIVEAAREILMAEGAPAVTMRRVADTVGVTAMAIYKHYPNRQVLMDTVVARAFQDLAAGWGRRAEGGDWESRALGLMHDFLDFALRTPHLYTYLMTERRESARRFPADFTEGASPAFTPTVSIIEEGMRLGLLKEDDALEVTLALTASIQGLVQLYLGGRIGLTEDDFRALCERTARRILNGIKA
ncbi:TetR/AcrR family transcriptional regulator [Microtetraspora malaysiensis]|uniref:TetR/AcrR family transcriptional regulator n=1 Tax=Microtetraspora malaysiensis TaxID=161358 RepID=UPI003D8CF964